MIESLNVVGMMKNHSLAKAIGDAGLSEFHRQIKYKVAWRGGMVCEADRFYPSSKTCSGCGNVKDTLLLSEREYVCEVCGLQINRDLNAALNPEKVGGKFSRDSLSPWKRWSEPASDETSSWAGTKRLGIPCGIKG